MFASLAVFLDFNLPNATTWFYFSFLLAMALFFKFSRLLSIRNWDVVFLFLLTPGLLLIQGDSQPAVRLGGLLGLSAPGQGVAPQLGAAASLLAGPGAAYAAGTWLWVGYLWLLLGSAYFFVRCLFDLALVQRPALNANLSVGGLAWMATALFICLLAVAFRQPDRLQVMGPKAASESVSTPDAVVGRVTAVQATAEEWFNAPDWMQRGFAVLCHLAVVVGLVLVAHLHFRDAAAGMAAATFYLMLPYTGFYVSQVHHVWPAALIIWAIVVYRTPMLSGALLGAAAGTAYFPALVFPLWLSFYSKRGAGRFAVMFIVSASFFLAALLVNLSINERLESALNELWKLDAWQPWKEPTTQGFWTGLHWAYRIPVFMAYLAFVIATAFWPTPKNLAQIIALSCALIIGIQFWYADRGGVYVLWYLPLLVLLVFRPNLADRLPDEINPEQDWLCRLKASLSRAARWVFHKLVPAKEEPARS